MRHVDVSWEVVASFLAIAADTIYSKGRHKCRVCKMHTRHLF